MQPQTLQQKDYNVLKECAQSYILSGKPLADMCDHNEKIARNLGKSNVSMLWHFVKIIYSTMPKQSVDQFRAQVTSQSLLMGNRMLMAAPNSIQPHWNDENADEKATNTNETIADEIQQNHFTIPKISELNKLTPNPNATTEDGSAMDALNNIVYGENELTTEHMDCIKSLRNGFLYIGPHDLTKNFSWPSDSIMNHDMQQSTRHQTMSRNRRDTSPVSADPMCTYELKGNFEFTI